MSVLKGKSPRPARRRKSADGLSFKRFNEEGARTAITREWRDKFGDGEIQGLREALGKHFSTQIVAALEERVRWYFDRSSRVYIRTPVSERTRALRIQKYLSNILSLTCGVEGETCYQTPAENLRDSYCQ